MCPNSASLQPVFRGYISESARKSERWYQNQRIINIGYADDTVIIARNLPGPQKIVDQVVQYSKYRILKFLSLSMNSCTKN